jgi:hypothetical protein
VGKAFRVKERPILFSAPMVRAILEGRKTQTRRALRDQQPVDFGATMHGAHLNCREVHDHGKIVGHRMALVCCPYGIPGDRLWVRETLYLDDDNKWRRTADESLIELDSNNEWVPYMLSWAHHKESDRCHSMYMPRFASRITLEVTGVRVERVQAIEQADAIAEGVDPDDYPPPPDPEGYVFNYRTGYRQLWDSLNAKRGFGWDENPWVWVVQFKRI